MTPDWAARATAVPYAVFGDPQTLNLYTYVENAPVNRVDADGHQDKNPQTLGPCTPANPCAMPKEPAQNKPESKPKPEAHKGGFFGVTAGVTAAAGVGKAGAAGTGDVNAMVMVDTQSKKPSAGVSASGGVVATEGSHSAGAPKQERASTAVGAFAGAGVGVTFGNAGNMQAMRDMTTTLSFDIAFEFGGSVQVSGNSQEGTWAVSITVGPGYGLAATQVNTATAGAATNNDGP